MGKIFNTFKKQASFSEAKLVSWKTFLISLLVYVLAQIPLSFMLCVRHHTRPYNNDFVLPDTIHKLTEDADYKLFNKISIIFSFSFLAVTIFLIYLQNHPLEIGSRVLFALAALTIVKICLLSGTDFPDPTKDCNCFYSQSYKLNFVEAMKSLFNINGCNSPFSGFISIVVICSMVIYEHVNKYAGLFAWALTFFVSIATVIARRCYTTDAVATAIITASVYGYMNSLFYTGKCKTQ